MLDCKGILNLKGIKIMFKKLVVMISTIETQEDFNIVWGAIDTAFQHEKISWNEHQTLFNLIKKITIKD